MLEPPDLPPERLARCLRAEFGLEATELAFLPIGADPQTAVFRAAGADGRGYFVKLRGESFDPVTVELPAALAAAGATNVVAPIPTADGRLFARLEPFAVILSPFVEGKDAYDRHLTDSQWAELGRGLRALHRARLPEDILRRIPRETFSGHFRDRLRAIQAAVATQHYADPVAAELAAFLHGERERVTRLIDRTERLAGIVAARASEMVVCHADLHAWNVLVADDGRLYIIDWDTLIVAPPERDLMFIGAGLGGIWLDGREAEHFFQGYGPGQPDLAALAYYRMERVIEDLVAYGDEILPTAGESADRRNGVRQVVGQFRPGSVLAIAEATAERALA